LTRAFPGAPLHTSFFEPGETFPEFAAVNVRTLPLNRLAPLRKRHRLALPALAGAFSLLRIEADVVVCSSSGWAHGARVNGHKIVYCHTPARWLYQPDRYLRGRGPLTRGVAAALRPSLIRWDKAAAASANRYLANSSAVAERIARIYGIEAEVLTPPPAVTPDGPESPIERLEPGFVLCVSRLLAYKNVDSVVRAFAALPNERLVVAGTGPVEPALQALATPNVVFLGRVEDAQLRWLYRHCLALVAASYEDLGLTPLEAGTFGRPSAVLRWGGFLDTVVEGTTAIFFETPTPKAVADAIGELARHDWNPHAITAHVAQFSEARFIERIRVIAGANGHA
jgi:glycosyltransferase involved in cell wall biosynthesis